MMCKDRQTVADIAVEHTGSSEAAFGIARRNSIAADTEVAGMTLPDEPVTDRRTVEFIRSQRSSPANVFGVEADVLTTDDESENVV